MKYEIIIVIIFILFTSQASYLYANEDDKEPIFYSIMPGGTHFYNGDILEGIAFSTLEVSLITTGILINNNLEKDVRNEWNIPLLLTSQIYLIDKWRHLQKWERSKIKNQNNKYPIRFDSTPLSKLLIAPFDYEVISHPLVIAAGLLGIVDGIVAYPKNKRKYSDISTVVALNNKMSRQTGTYYYECMAFAGSYGAAVSEEMLFRGLLLPLIDCKFGKRAGLITTSMTFGLAHLFNSDIDKPLYFISQATLAGLVFGYYVQQNDYRLSEVIAAHFWYNIASLTTTWLHNPNENPLGIGVNFKF